MIQRIYSDLNTLNAFRIIILLLVSTLLSQCKPFVLEELMETNCVIKNQWIYDGEDMYTINYVYNDKHQLIEQQSIDSMGNIIAKQDFLYDASGNVNTLTLYENEMLVRIWERDWNEAGDIILDICYDEAGNLSYQHNYEYENGFLVKISKFTPPSDLKTDIIEYDEQGIKVAEYRYTGDELSGALLGITHFSYDEVKNCSEIEYEGPNGEQGGKYIFKFNECGDIIERTSLDFSGEIITHITYAYIYDADKNILTQATYLNSGGITRIDYTYDEYGNEIEKIESDGDGIIIRREQTSYHCFEQSIH